MKRGLARPAWLDTHSSQPRGHSQVQGRILGFSWVSQSQSTQDQQGLSLDPSVSISPSPISSSTQTPAKLFCQPSRLHGGQMHRGWESVGRTRNLPKGNTTISTFKENPFSDFPLISPLWPCQVRSFLPVCLYPSATSLPRHPRLTTNLRPLTWPDFFHGIYPRWSLAQALNKGRESDIKTRG